MSMIFAILFTLIGLGCYGHAILQSRACVQQQSKPHLRLHLWVLLGLCSHFIASQLLLWASGQLQLSVFNAASAILLLISLILCINAIFRPLFALYPWILSAHAFLAILALLLPGLLLSQSQWSWLLASHVILAMTSFSLIALAAVMALVILVQTHQLRQHRLSKTMLMLPPLQLSERLHFELLLVGFVLLTLAITLGSFNHQSLFSWPLANWQKSLGSLVGWSMLAMLLLGHLLAGWRGAFAAKLTLSIGLILSLAYLSSKVLSIY